VKRIVYTVTAARALRRDANRARAIQEKVEQLAADPASLVNNVKVLIGVDAKRLRVGDFRVLFRETETEILILDIGPRGSVYE
jgi:mRNA interferase RelE/StbE